MIIITPNDPFDHDLMMYTVKNSIKELLHYMEHTTEENATTDALKRIHKMVETIKMDEEVSHKYMKILEREEMLIEKGQKIGQEIGKEIGRKMERENTERERRRADAAEKELVYWKNLALGIS